MEWCSLRRARQSIEIGTSRSEADYIAVSFLKADLIFCCQLARQIEFSFRLLSTGQVNTSCPRTGQSYELFLKKGRLAPLNYAMRIDRRLASPALTPILVDPNNEHRRAPCLSAITAKSTSGSGLQKPPKWHEERRPSPPDTVPGQGLVRVAARSWLWVAILKLPP